jgi:hypothetical protein
MDRNELAGSGQGLSSHVDVMIVMPGLVPGIQALPSSVTKDVDGRDKPGHDKGVLRLIGATCASSRARPPASRRSGDGRSGGIRRDR